MRITERRDSTPVTRPHSVRSRTDSFTRLPRAAVALGMSVLLWLYVGAISNPQSAPSVTFYPEVPVKLSNLDQSLLLAGTSPTVAVRVRNVGGPTDEITGQPAVFVDLSGLGPGTRLIPVNIEGLNDRRVVSIEPPQVRITLEKAQRRVFSVQARVIGLTSATRPDTELTVSPPEVTVVGSKAAIQKVSAVTAVVEEAAIRPGAVQTVPVQAVDPAGRPLQGLTLNPAEVRVTAPVSPTATP